MRAAAFLEALQDALRAVEGVGVVHGATCWPRTEKGRIRLLVPQAGWQGDPCIVDPVGLVYLHRTGHVLGLLDGLKAGLALGFTSEVAIDVLQACDWPVGTAAHPAVPIWRAAIESVLLRWVADLEAQTSAARK